MRIFLGWSGSSRDCAKALETFLQGCFDTHIEILVSWEIAKGDYWTEELQSYLETADFAILSIVPGNRADWLCFEAGAVSANGKGPKVNPVRGRVASLFFDKESEAVFPPLEHTQNVRFERKEIYALVSDLHTVCNRLDADKEKRLLGGDTLDDNFKKYYPAFEAAVLEILKKRSYLLSDFEKDVEKLKNMPDAAQWVYHRGIALVRELRSDEVSLLKKAASAKDFRDTVLMPNRIKYPEVEAIFSQFDALR